MGLFHYLKKYCLALPGVFPIGYSQPLIFIEIDVEGDFSPNTTISWTASMQLTSSPSIVY